LNAVRDEQFDISDPLMRSIAFPKESDACMRVHLFRAGILRVFTALVNVPAVSIKSSTIRTFLPFTSPTIFITSTSLGAAFAID